MATEKHLTTLSWPDYELLDSGENMKLERYGEIIVARPDTQAIWKKSKPELWKGAHAVFAFGDKKGSWDLRKPVPDSWPLSCGPLRFSAKLTGFKHTGIFPEQEPNWVWLQERVQNIPHTEETPRASVLNLFGYTGVATLAAAHAGAFVTHADASKQSIDWARANARLTELPEDRVRWIFEDALSFVKREARRGSTYEGIVLDPPAFGRGAKGEVWKIEENLPELMEALTSLLSTKRGSFFLINGYAAGYAPQSFLQLVESYFPALQSEFGELRIKESTTDRSISAGMYVRFVR